MSLHTKTILIGVGSVVLMVVIFALMLAWDYHAYRLDPTATYTHMIRSLPQQWPIVVVFVAMGLGTVAGIFLGHLFW